MWYVLEKKRLGRAHCEQGQGSPGPSTWAETESRVTGNWSRRNSKFRPYQEGTHSTKDGKAIPKTRVLSENGSVSRGRTVPWSSLLWDHQLRSLKNWMSSFSSCLWSCTYAWLGLPEVQQCWAQMEEPVQRGCDCPAFSGNTKCLFCITPNLWISFTLSSSVCLATGSWLCWSSFFPKFSFSQTLPLKF
jgi:hypothetical protein